MLTDQVFYHNTTKKLIVAFGNVFNDLTFKRFDEAGNTVSFIKVPIVFAPREKYMVVLKNAMSSGVQTVLPRMSFFLTGFGYDPTRAINSVQKIVRPIVGTNQVNKYSLTPVPWNVDFTLSVYARNLEDGYQILEQVLPYFTPALNLTLNEIDGMQIMRDVPLVLNTTTLTEDYELGTDAKTRKWIVDLGFTMKAYYYGNIKESRAITTTISQLYSGAQEDYTISDPTSIPGSNSNAAVQMTSTAGPANVAMNASFTVENTKLEGYEFPV